MSSGEQAKVAYTVLSATERVGIPDLDGASSPLQDADLRFQSGLRVRGKVFASGQPNRLRVFPGATVTWTGGYGKVGMAADGRLPFPAPIPIPSGHTSIAPISSYTFQAGDRVTLWVPTPVQHNTVYIEEAVLIECESAFSVAPALDSHWPSSITGFTSQDVSDFLDDTIWWPETKQGWQGRFGHPDLNTPGVNADAGYGGLMADVTSLGALLLCSSTLSATEKLAVQTRLLLMAGDLERFGCTYPANGGHGNGRYILWLIRQMVLGAPTSLFTAASFSENVQVTRDAGNNIVWSMYGTLPVAPSDAVYQYCCTANRWAGAACTAKLVSQLGASASDWVTFSMTYLAANISNPTAYYFVDGSRLRTVIAANRATIGF